MVASQVLQEIPAGNIKEIHPETMVHDLVYEAQKLGPIFQFTPPNGRRQIVLSSYELVNEVCNDTLFDKQASALASLQDTTGDGLFTAETDDPNWHKAHSILMPCFSLAAMKQYFPMMLDGATQLVEKWQRLNPEDEIDVGDDMSRVTLEIIGMTGFNYRFHSFQRQEPHPFVQSMLRSLSSARARASRPPIEDKLRIRERRQHQADMDLMFSTVDRLIQERKATGPEASQIPDLLNAMLNGVDKQTGERLDDVNIRYQVMTFLIAGHETTSSLLSFALFFLINHPEVLAKAYNEVDRVLGKDLSVMPTYEQVHQLHYLTQILNETLRMCPPAPGFTRHAREDRLLAGCYQISKEDSLRTLTVMLHRDRSVWGEDAEIFNPDSHFSPQAVKARPNNAYLPFGFGLRSCIGRQFAMQEAPLILGMILQRFLLYSPRIYQLKIREALTIKPQDFFLKVKPRSEVDQAVTLAPPAESKTSTPAPQQAREEVQPEQNVEIPTEIARKTALLVLYGSNTGTAEELANRIATDGKNKGFTASIGALDDHIDKLPKEGVVLIVTSTYNGTPPDNARAFCQWLQGDLAKDALKGVKYTVFGCGNHEWASTYQAIPTSIDKALEQHGATRIYPRGTGDVASDFDGEFLSWYQGLWKMAEKALALKAGMLKPVTNQGPLYEVEIVRRPRPFPFVNSFGAQPMTILENRELAQMQDGKEPERSTRHIQISLPTNTHYRTADHLGVLASNEDSQIKRVASRFQFDQHTIIQIHATNGRRPVAPTDEPISVYDLLANYVELQDVARREQMKRMMEYTSDEGERQHLARLCGEDKIVPTTYQAEVLAKHKAVIDLLEEHPSCALPFPVYLEFLPPLRPRYYSISSSPLVNPTECSITVGVVKGPSWSGHGLYEGVCSEYLSQQPRGEILYGFIQDTNSPFHLPEDDSVSLIMISPGTGIAPFRGFLQERAARKKLGKKIGKSLLFFGCRHPEEDFLYQEELEGFQKDGITTLYTAFSRLDPKKKVYVQDTILEHKDEVWQFLQDGACVYICGDTAYMAPAVRQTFLKLYQEKTGKKEPEATQWLAEMEKQQRYLVDIWGS
jgi:cytochrome P450 / NADPH-cytochrome P450 reductase